MFRKISILFFLIFSVHFLLHSQQDYFHSETYIEDLKNFLTPVFKNNPEVKTEFDKLSSHWDTLTSLGYNIGITFVSNALKNSYAKPYPDFYNYIRTVNKLVEINKTDYYMEWEAGLTSILQNRRTRRKFKDYLKVSADFICDSLLLRTGIVQWKARAQNYSIEYTADKGLFIAFNDTMTLYIHNSIDTMRILGVKGICYPLKKVWEGYGGKVYWTQAGIYSKRIFVRMPETYKLDMHSNKFYVDSVHFTNEFLNLYNIEGTLIFKLKNSANTQVPIFKAYSNTLQLKLPKTPISVKGKFYMQGNEITFKEAIEPVYYNVFENMKSENIIMKGSCRMLKVKYKIKNDKLLDTFTIKAPSSSIAFKLKENDSLYHTNVYFKYYTQLNTKLYKANWFNSINKIDLNRPVITLYTTSKSTNIKPFNDEYHKLDIFASDLVWFVGDSLLYILLTYHTSAQKAFFQSSRIFSPKVYKFFSGQNTDNVNFLTALNYFYQRNKDVITIEMLEDQLGLKYEQYIKEMLFKLQDENFVKYYPEKDKIVILPKVARYIANYTYIQYAQVKDTSQYLARFTPEQRQDFLSNRIADFDRIFIQSKPEQRIGIVGYINLKNTKLNILHPQPFYLSFPQRDTLGLYKNVGVIPDSTIVIDKNLSMTFSGKIGAGLATITGKNFKFDYDSYTVKFDNAQMHYAFKEDSIIHPLTTNIDNVKGTLYINSPKNKSGVYRKPEFPKLHIDNSEVLYKKQNFQFHFYSYDLDSLNFLNAGALNMKGTLITNIIPDQKNTILKPTEFGNKYQLGFTKCKHFDGFPLSKHENEAQGRFYGCIRLGDNGLEGSGLLFYYNSVYYGNFVFTSQDVTAKKLRFIFINTDSLDNLFAYHFNNIETEIDTAVEKTTLDTIKHCLKSYKQFLKRIGKLSDYQKYVAKTPTVYNVKENYPVSFKFDKKQIFLDDYRLRDSTHLTLIFYPELKERKPYFKGHLTYKNGLLKANGMLSFNKNIPANNAIITDTNIIFEKQKIYNKTFTAAFRIKGSFNTNKQKFVISIPQKQGIFTSKDLNSIIFNKNKYTCSADHFVWDIQLGLMNIGQVIKGENPKNYITDLRKYKQAKKNGKNVRFFGAILSPYKDKDIGPSFSAGYVDYNSNIYKLTGYRVPKITLADAIIYPQKQPVSILIKGVFDTLNNVSLDFIEVHYDTVHTAENKIDSIKREVVKYTFNQVKGLKIQDKDSYIADEGIYTYGYNNQRVKMTDIRYLKDEGYSYAFSDDLSLTSGKLDLNPYFRIINKNFSMKIYEPRYYPIISGYVLPTLLAQNDDYKKYHRVYSFYIKENEANYKNLILQYTDGEQGYSYDQRTRPALYVKVSYTNKGLKRDLFIEPLQIGKNILALPKHCNIWYENGKYQIAADMGYDTTTSNAVAYNNALNIYNAQGKFLIDSGLLKVKTNIYGYYTHNYNSKADFIRGVLVLDKFPLPLFFINSLDSALTQSDLKTIFDDEKINRTRKNYTKLLGKDKVNEIFSDIEDYEQPKIISENDFVFSDVQLYYTVYKKGREKIPIWYSKGQIGIASINGRKINRYVPGIIILRLKKSNPMLYIELKPNPTKEPYIFLFNLNTDGKNYLNIYYPPLTNKEEFSGSIKNKLFTARSKKHKSGINVYGRGSMVDIYSLINKQFLDKIKSLSKK